MPRGVRIWSLRILLGLLGLLIVLALALGIVWGCAYAVKEATEPDFKTRPFNSQLWIASHGKRESVRGRMLDDLMGSDRLRVGMKESEVLQLLGRPDAADITTTPKEDHVPFERPYAYWTGPYYGCINQVLHVGYNRQGRLKSVLQQYPKDTCRS